MSREPLPPDYQLVKDKVLEQWWIIGNGDILIPHAIGNYDEAYALALHLSREEVLRDANTKAGKQ
jgi:hypothetical protein